MTSDGAIARRVRLNVVPFVIPMIFSFAATRRFMFRTISQTAVNYRGSRLSEGRAGSVHGGDRLPWVAAGSNDVDNFTPLTSLDWQVHVYGSATPEIQAVCKERTLPLHVFPWRPEMGRAGLRRNAVYLVRPDGYVALAARESSRCGDHVLSRRAPAEFRRHRVARRVDRRAAEGLKVNHERLRSASQVRHSSQTDRRDSASSLASLGPMLSAMTARAAACVSLKMSNVEYNVNTPTS